MEYKHLLTLCPYQDDTITQELSILLDEITDNPNANFVISENCFVFFSKNINSNDALPIITLLLKIKSILGNKLKSIDEFILKELGDLLEKSLNSEETAERQRCVARFLNIFIHFECTDRLPNLIEKLRKLANLGFTKEIYCGLLIKKDEFLLKKFINDNIEQNPPLLWKPIGDVMIDLTISTKKHWLSEMVTNFTNSIIRDEAESLEENLFVKYLINLSIIHLINQQHDDSDLTSFLSNLNKILDKTDGSDCHESVSFYIDEIKRENKLLQFCIRNTRKKSHFGWLNQVLNQSALSFISQNCDISSLDSSSLLELLQNNNNMLCKLYELPKSESPWDIAVYKSYCIIIFIIDLILTPSDIQNDVSIMNSKFEEIKKLYSSITSIEDKIEILQNIFVCLFLRTEYFCDDIVNGKQHFIRAGFLCSRTLVKKILYFLKNCLNEIQEFCVGSTINEDFIKLQKHISDSIWKYQTITTLKIDTSVKQSQHTYLYEDILDHSSDDESKGTLTRRKLKIKKRRKSNNDSGTDPPKDTATSPTQEKLKFINEDFISLMLSPPSTLLCLCLENTDFSRANKIIDLYNLHNTQEASEVKFTENYLNTVMHIKQQFKKTDYINHTESLTETSALAATIISLIETFLSSNTQCQDLQISELSRFHSELYVYNQKYLPLLAITDLAISTGLNKNITYGIMNIAEKKLQEVMNGDCGDLKHWNCIMFIKNMINLVYDLYKGTNKEYSNFSMCDILKCDKLPLKYKEYQQINDFFDKVSLFTTSITNESQKSYMKSLTDLYNLCNKQVINLCPQSNLKNINSCSYLKHTLTYAKSIYELINLRNQDSEENQTDFLKLRLHEIISQLIVDDKAPLENIESVCKLLGIDFIQKLVLNICPTIECFRRRSSRDCNFMEILLEIDDQSPSTEFISVPITLTQPVRKIMVHILIHNWIIGYLVKRIHSDNTDYILKESVDTRTKFLDAYLSLERFNNLKILCGNNNIITALQTTYNSHNLKLLLKDLLRKNEFDQCLQVLNSLPVYYFNLHPTLLDLKDEILLNVARNVYLTDNWKYFLKISNHDLQIRNLFEILQLWQANGAKEVLNFIKSHLKFRENKYVINECNIWLAKIPIYEKIAKVHEYSSWNEIYKLSTNDPESVLQLLMDENQHKLCLKWLNIHMLSNNVQNLVTFNYLKMILKSQEYISATELKDLLSELPPEQSLTLLVDSVSKIKDINLLNVCVDFLIAESELSKFENIRIGIRILEILDEKERTFFWDIINKPLLIIEQYLMNAKFDRLSKILNKIRPQLKQDPYGDNLFFNINLINTCLISNNSVDALLRLYAAKSLDLKSSKVNQELQISRKTDELCLQSIDSINLVGETEKFVMPEVIPTREQWISNDFSESCMSCKTTIFSILIRKHHCRRCGRLICYYCSRNRMQIENMYDGIKVRVCNDCYTQTMNKSNCNEPKNYSVTSVTSTGSVQSEQLSMEWCLTANVKHNYEIRREFSYEFSPNVTLFLTIMKMHTINFDYQRFLNEKSSDLLKSAKELGENKTGCDNICELLKMRKSLLVWCTVLYSQPSLIASSSLTNAAIADTEHQLAATDALTLLASHGYHSLIPQKDTPDYKSHLQKPVLYSKLFTQSIRKLLEDEKWDLALEISTKFGFPRNSVLAAWGKACLRAGCFESARQKFSFCFNKNPNNPASSELNVSSTTIQQDIYKTKTNPLLEEIIAILENGSYVVNSQVIKKANTIKVSQEKLITEKKPNKKVDMNEPAINIMHSLSSIQKLKMGDYSDFSTAQLYIKKPKSIGITRKASSQNEKLENKLVIDKYFYDECLYYLTTYGSHSLILEFYLKYDNLNEALIYCHENAVEKEIFTEYVFYNCLRTNKINRLLAMMNEIDHSWNKWMEYIIHFCRSLEHKGSLESLLTVQVGIEDYVRAAITCANLYMRPTIPPHANALYKRADYLIQAQAHLQRVPRKLSDPGFAEMSTRSLQLKMDVPSLNKHINTFRCQIEIASFLNTCELKGNLKNNVIIKMLSSSTIDDAPKNECFLPTLFSDHSRKIQLAALVIICASDTSEGFNLSTKVIREQNLDSTKVFSITVRSLVSIEKFENIIKVCELIVNERKPDSRQVCDTIVEISIGAIVRKCDSQKQLFDELAEVLIQKVESIAIKISCYIECRLLKTAYTLAVKHERVGDLRRIMREAEKLGQIQVKKACSKRLEKMSQS